MGITNAHRPDDGRATEDPVEAALVALFEELLEAGPVNPDDNFLELGGNSLLAIQLMVRVREMFDVKVRVAEFFKVPTVRGLGELLVTHLVRTSSDAEDQADAS
jgi:acyl carrier protein